jgi:hypothetical protein
LITSLHPHQISLTPIHPNFIYGLNIVVLGSKDVGAVFGLEKVATLSGCERKRSRRLCASSVPPWIEVVASSNPICDIVGTE